MRIVSGWPCSLDRWLPAVLATVFLVGCAGAGEGAVKGAAGGALAGAASGLVSALVWGGDPGEYMARGATAGATVGAIGGAVEGSSRASAEKNYTAAQEQQEIEQFKREIGTEAFDGIVALAECKHEVAVAKGRLAAESKNGNYALAGLWVQALSFADQDNESGINDVMTEIVRWDREVADEAQFRKGLNKTSEELKDIRSEYNLPRQCSG